MLWKLVKRFPRFYYRLSEYAMTNTTPSALTRRAAIGLAGTGMIAVAPGTSSVRASDKLKRTLVLGGGGIKGAYQAGAVKAVLKRGFRPHCICGISVGALNAAFLADRASFLSKTLREYYVGLAKTIPARANLNALVTWPFLGEELELFWLENITGPQALVRKHTDAGTFISVLFANFRGLLRVDPLRGLIDRELARSRIANQNIEAFVGAVNVDKGTLIYFRNTDNYFREGIIASSAVPIQMPVVNIDRGPHPGRYCDGGLVNILPIRKALEEGSSHCISIVCQSPTSDYKAIDKITNITQVLARYSEITSDRIIEDDVAFAKARSKVIVIRPKQPPNLDAPTGAVYESDDFPQRLIKAMTVMGESDANDALDDLRNKFVDDGFNL